MSRLSHERPDDWEDVIEAWIDSGDDMRDALIEEIDR